MLNFDIQPEAIGALGLVMAAAGIIWLLVFRARRRQVSGKWRNHSDVRS